MDYLAIISAVFGVLVLVLGGLVALLGGGMKALRDSNKDLRDAGSDRDLKIATMAAEIVTLKNDRDALARAVRGDDQLDLLAAKLDEHHQEAKVHWMKDEELLADVRDRLAGGAR